MNNHMAAIKDKGYLWCVKKYYGINHRSDVWLTNV